MRPLQTFAIAVDLNWCCYLSIHDKICMLEIVQQFSIMLYMEVTTLPPISLNFLIDIVMKLSLRSVSVLKRHLFSLCI